MRALLLFAVLTLLAAPVRADQGAADARAHFEKAKTAYALGEFDKAIAEFREAYRLKQEPAILFNIAQACRQSGQYKQALFYYRQYLGLDLNAPNRPAVETLIDQMQAKVDEQEKKDREAAAEQEKAAAAAAALAAQHGQAVPAVAKKPGAAPAAVWQSQPAAPAPASHVLRYAGYAAMGVGVAAEALAFVFHGSAQSAADQFNSKYAAGTLTSSDAQLKSDAESKGSLATVSAIAGAALLAGGGVLSFAF